MKKKTKFGRKAKKVMKEYGAGELHSGKGGPVVTDQDQALAIAFSEQRKVSAKKRTRKRKG